jgi:Tripartite ATP-independent periplasmic transporter, DctM component
VNLQTAFLTPPVGFSLFYMRAVAPASITTGDIYRGAVPFVCLQVMAIAILWVAPELATWLPKVVFPGAVPAAAGGPSGSVLDDILGGPLGGAPAAPPASPLDDLLGQPPAAPQPQGGDPVLDRLMRRD